jgi:hypothetical protein
MSVCSVCEGFYAGSIEKHLFQIMMNSRLNASFCQNLARFATGINQKVRHREYNITKVGCSVAGVYKTEEKKDRIDQ